MVKAEIRESLRQFQEALGKSGIRVSKLILYGSCAGGEVREYSDIDVAVVSPDFGKDRFDEGVKLFTIAAAIDPRTEPVPVSVEQYETGDWIPLIYEIKEKGIELTI